MEVQYVITAVGLDKIKYHNSFDQVRNYVRVHHPQLETAGPDRLDDCIGWLAQLDHIIQYGTWIHERPSLFNTV